MTDDKSLRRAEIAGMLRDAARRHVSAPGRAFVFGSQANRATMKRADIDMLSRPPAHHAAMRALHSRLAAWNSANDVK